MFHDYALQKLHYGGSDYDGPILIVLGNGWIFLIEGDYPGLKVPLPLGFLRTVVLFPGKEIEHLESVGARLTAEGSWFLALTAIFEVEEGIIYGVEGDCLV